MKNIRALLAITLLLGMVLTACGQPLPEPADVIALYEGVAPGSEGWDWEESHVESRAGLPITQNVVKPVLMYYPPDPGTDVGTAMVVAPGGGFRNLMMSYEGVDVARYLNKLGVHAYVLKYRLIARGTRVSRMGRMFANWRRPMDSRRCV